MYRMNGFDNEDEDLQKPCDPINVPNPKELEKFKPESIPGEPEVLYGNISYSKQSVSYTEEDIKKNPMLREIMDNMKWSKAAGMDFMMDEYKKAEKLGFKKECIEETKKLIDKFKKLQNTKEFKRIHEISIRVDTVEKSKIEERAKSFGFKNVSDYMRFVALNSYLMAGIDKFNKVVDDTSETATKEEVEKKFN